MQNEDFFTPPLPQVLNSAEFYTDKLGYYKGVQILTNQARLIDQYDRLTINISPSFDPKTRNWDQMFMMKKLLKKNP